MTPHEKNDFISLQTDATLVLDANSQTSMLSGKDGEKYPVINAIPILVEEPGNFLADAFVTYRQHLLTQEDLIQEFTTSFAKHPMRLSIFENLKKAIEHNAAIIKPMTDVIESFFTKDQLLHAALNGNHSRVEYLKAFRYLKRDWCGLAESEEQLKIIHSALKEGLHFLDDRDSSLVLGAGVGRVACDLHASFSRIFAMDKSWSMAYFSQKVMRENVLFYEINHNNILRSIHSTRLLRAGFSYVGTSEEDVADIREKLSYFVGDVRKIPLPDESVSCVLSVYFTDVIALESYMAEVHRVLKKGGIFIHFGPLGYQFRAIENMLTAEEIKAWYFKLGYEHLLEKTVETKHLASHDILYNATVNNWLFVTRKKTDAFTLQASNFTDDSIPELVSGFQYAHEGTLNVQGRNSEKFTITATNGKKYAGSESFLDFIGLMDGRRSLSGIVEELGGRYDLSEMDRRELLSLTSRLLRDGVIQIKPRTS